LESFWHSWDVTLLLEEGAKKPDDDSIFNVSEANEEVVLEIEKLSIKADGKTKEDKKVAQ
jgi:hypothetical protein